MPPSAANDQMSVMIDRNRLTEFFDELLQPNAFVDYGPNGLQVEGRVAIERIAFAVSATAHSVREAVNRDAHALVVHHGLLWSFHGVRTLTGPFARRVFPLIRHDINLYGYHLPLDAHPEIGNAACLARRLNVLDTVPFGDHKGCPTGVRGRLALPVTAEALRDRLAGVLNHAVLMASPDPRQMIRSVGIITGGANGDWVLARQIGLDAYVTGEMSEHDWHESQEAGVHMFAGGHYATEQFGIQALLEQVRDRFGAECFFILSENPA